MFNNGVAQRVFKAGRRVERGDETARNQFIDATFLFFQFAGHLPGGNDGEVVGHLGVVEDALVVAVDVVVVKDLFGPVTDRSLAFAVR